MPDSIMERLHRTSHFNGGNAAYIEELYEKYLHDPNSVSHQWRAFFDSLPSVQNAQPDTSHATIQQQFELLGRNRARISVAPGSGGAANQHERKQVKVLQMINAYRSRGHMKAKLDPLGIAQRPHVDGLELQFHGLTSADLDTTFQIGSLFIGKAEATLREIVTVMEDTYCGSLGPEYNQVTDLSEKRWLQQRFESVTSRPRYGNAARIDVLKRLTAAEGMERHLDSKFPGTKRFGLEGSESLIPMLDGLIRRAGEYGAKDIVMGMAHRGRLNVLVNVLGKNPSELFSEFEGKKLVNTSGDVKYHQGFSSSLMTPGGEVHLALGFNPSHLEIACPVVLGSCRARQDRRQDSSYNQVVPILIHGDAAFSGQGVVMETFQMSQTRAYKTGGTVHIVLNNQIGFTTNRKDDTRSTEYCTDVAKIIEAPVFHVNGDDPDAVMLATLIAMDYRNEFHKDVVIDLVCYRRRGHNETDEPSTTQPLMYQVIRKHKTTRALYAERLVRQKVLTEEEADKYLYDYRASLDKGEDVTHNLVNESQQRVRPNWTPFLGQDWRVFCETGYELHKLQEVAHRLCHIPDGIVAQRQVGKIYDDRRMMGGGAMPLNWGMAELLAYATLLEEGYPIRMTGQDIGRGTFSHRHAVIHNQKDGEAYTPLNNMSDNQPSFDLFDSLLSEEAVLAFEYGYATNAPDGLVIWEAQFGDFANGAQVVIDQFITSGQQKWGRLCGLTMLLPHGYEGQGPEHSSARLERYLQLCAEHNIQVCIPTTPAQVFHMLRRQAIRPMRRPLVVMSPKWILRHKLATSSLEDLANGSFQSVIDDPVVQSADIKRLILCSGKVYYHLYEAREVAAIDNVAFVRIEQLYPFPDELLDAVVAKYTNIESMAWCQEEPINQGAWYQSQHHMRQVMAKHNDLHLDYVGRQRSASPAAGYMSSHLEEQQCFINKALMIENN